MKMPRRDGTPDEAVVMESLVSVDERRNDEKGQGLMRAASAHRDAAQNTAKSERPNLTVEPEVRSMQRGKVLVVDDEPMIGRYLSAIMSTDHDVTVCASVREALDRLREGARFDAILCDLMMPGLTGMDLHAELTSSAPDQAERMIFITGGAFTNASKLFLDTVPNQRLHKPFNTASLRELSRSLVR